MSLSLHALVFGCLGSCVHVDFFFLVNVCTRRCVLQLLFWMLLLVLVLRAIGFDCVRITL